MKYSKVTLLHHTPLDVAVGAIRTCWDSGDKSDSNQGELMGEKDKALVYRVGNKNRHSSTLEHISFNFYIEGVSRAILQELARHRMASLSVKSTRYTLKELKDEEPFIWLKKDDEDVGTNPVTEDIHGICWVIPVEAQERALEYVAVTDDTVVNIEILKSLENLRALVKSGIANDKTKYALPESYRVNLTWSINLRSLQNLVYLRSDKSALLEFRLLVENILRAIPEEYMYLLDEFDRGKQE